MIKGNCADLLKDDLRGTGFVRRGAAYFRVWGDGVLQVLKFERQPGGRSCELRVGIFSMYGKLRPEWFTSGGCIPRGSIARFVGLRSAEGWLSSDCFTRTDDEQFVYEGFPVSVDPEQRLWDEHGERWKYRFTAEQQAAIFAEKALPWLNDVTNQSLAAKAMYEICPVPNDGLRFDAHLAAGEWTQAEQTISAILKQHASARASWEQTLSQGAFAEMAARQETEDTPLKVAYRMVQEKDEEAIHGYLSDNYRRNCKLAEFCVKKA